MATITSSVSGTTTTYTITDQSNNTYTVTALAPPGGVSISSSGSPLIDGEQLLTTLLQMLSTGLRPNVMVNTKASFNN